MSSPKSLLKLDHQVLDRSVEHLKKILFVDYLKILDN